MTSVGIPMHYVGVPFRFAHAKLEFRPCVVLDTLQAALATQRSEKQLAMLDSPAFSDCQLLPTGETTPIHVSRAILAQRSPFFHTMFAGEWAESTQRNLPVKISWPARVVVLCLIHVYCDWLPMRPIPDHIPSIKEHMRSICISLGAASGSNSWMRRKCLDCISWRRPRMLGRRLVWRTDMSG